MLVILMRVCLVYQVKLAACSPVGLEQQLYTRRRKTGVQALESRAYIYVSTY